MPGVEEKEKSERDPKDRNGVQYSESWVNLRGSIETNTGDTARQTVGDAAESPWRREHTANEDSGVFGGERPDLWTFPSDPCLSPFHPRSLSKTMRVFCVDTIS